MTGVKKFYMITGKGGVGKTAISLSLAKKLKQDFPNRRIVYSYFYSTSLKEESLPYPIEHNLAQKLGLDVLPLDIEVAATKYVSKKLHSKIIGSFVVKTPFFKALINMIPGFSYLIFLGHILDEIINSKEEVSIILDGPASGHALMMFEVTENFQKIFGSGLIFEDTKKMLELLLEKNFAEVNVITIPTEMAMEEGRELKSSLEKILPLKTNILCNNVLTIPEEEKKPLPNFLKQRMANEKALLEQSNDILKILPEIFETDELNKILSLKKHL